MAAIWKAQFKMAAIWKAQFKMAPIWKAQLKMAPIWKAQFKMAPICYKTNLSWHITDFLEVLDKFLLFGYDYNMCVLAFL